MFIMINWSTKKAILWYLATKTDFGKFIPFNKIDSIEKHHKYKSSKIPVFNESGVLDESIGKRLLIDLK